MPSFKKKQFKNPYFQKLCTLKRPQVQKGITITKYVMVHTLMDQNIKKLLGDTSKIVKSTKYKFIKGGSPLLAKTMPNVLIISEEEILSISLDPKILVENITKSLTQINVKIDLISFPSRMISHKKTQTEKNNINSFSRTIRSIITYFKKSYKTTTFDEFYKRLPSIPDIETNVPIFFAEKTITNSEIIQNHFVEKNTFLIKGFLTHNLQSNNLLLNGEIKGKIIRFKSYESEEDCYRDSQYFDMGILQFDNEKESLEIKKSNVQEQNCPVETQLNTSENTDIENENRFSGSTSDDNYASYEGNSSDNNDFLEKNENLDSLNSPLINELKHFKGIKDLKTCKIPSSYAFKPKKNKIEKLGKFCTFLVESDFVSDITFATNIVDGRMCLLNVLFGENQIVEVKKNTFSPTQKKEEKITPCFVEIGASRYKTVPFFSRQSTNTVHKIVSTKNILEGGQFVCTFAVPYEKYTGKVIISLDLEDTDSKLIISSSIFNNDSRSLIEEKRISGSPYKSFNNFVKIKNMFDSRDEVLYFNNLRLYCREERKKREKVRNIVDQNLMELTQKHKTNNMKLNNLKKDLKNENNRATKNTLPYSRINTGKIISPIGLNGCFKAEFVRPVRMGTEIWISVYRNVDPLKS